MKEARKMPQFNLRLTQEMKGWIERVSSENHRSINSEINFILEQYRKNNECKSA